MDYFLGWIFIIINVDIITAVTIQYCEILTVFVLGLFWNIVLLVVLFNCKPS